MSLNTRFAEEIVQYRAIQIYLQTRNLERNECHSRVDALPSRDRKLSEALKECKFEISEKGCKMTDSSPVVDIK